MGIGLGVEVGEFVHDLGVDCILSGDGGREFSNHGVEGPDFYDVGSGRFTGWDVIQEEIGVIVGHWEERLTAYSSIVGAARRNGSGLT